MLRTLKSKSPLWPRYWLLFKHIALINPGHDLRYVQMFKSAHPEWAFVADQLNLISYCSTFPEFSATALPLVIYIKEKRKEIKNNANLQLS